MKKSVFIFLLLGYNTFVFAQKTEVKQLLLNAEKLAQFKEILKEMKEGYQVIASGYSAIKNISEGNFSLHQAFLDGLLEVSPEVRKYRKVTSIAQLEGLLLKACSSSFSRFSLNGFFTASELQFIDGVYRKLRLQSLENLDDLITVLTAGELRMSDKERLRSIDRIFERMRDGWVFLVHFNRDAAVLAKQREKEKEATGTLKQWYHLTE